MPVRSTPTSTATTATTLRASTCSRLTRDPSSSLRSSSPKSPTSSALAWAQMPRFDFSVILQQETFSPSMSTQATGCGSLNLLHSTETFPSAPSTLRSSQRQNGSVSLTSPRSTADTLRLCGPPSEISAFGPDPGTTRQDSVRPPAKSLRAPRRGYGPLNCGATLGPLSPVFRFLCPLSWGSAL